MEKIVNSEITQEAERYGFTAVSEVVGAEVV